MGSTGIFRKRHNFVVTYIFVGEGFTQLTGFSPSSQEARAGAQGTNLEVGTEAQTVEEGCFGCGFPSLAHITFSCSLGPPA